MTSEPYVVTNCLLVARYSWCFTKKANNSSFFCWNNPAKIAASFFWQPGGCFNSLQTFSVFASCLRLEAAWNILVPHNVHSTIAFKPYVQ